MNPRKSRNDTKRARLAQSPPKRTVTVLTDLRDALNSLASELEASRLLGAAVNAVASRRGYERLEADIREEMQKIAAAKAG